MSKAKDLTSVINIDDIEYNINAVHSEIADKTTGTLKIKLKDTEVTTLDTAEISFNGEADQTLSIVPASGGTFLGPIQIPTKSRPDSADSITIGETEVLNYADIKELVVKDLLNNALLYTWKKKDNDEEYILSETGKESGIQSISIITGPEGQADDFAKYNHDKLDNDTTDNDTPKLAAFIYISEGNTEDPGIGKIYFGTSQSDKVVSVEVSANSAITAERLLEAQKIKIDLSLSSAESNGVSFDGTTPITLGISSGILPTKYGGTGKTNLNDVTVGEAIKLKTKHTIRTNLASPSSVGFDGTGNITPGVTGILSEANGGTGTTDLNKVTVGNSKKSEASETTKVMYGTSSLSTTTTAKYPKITISKVEPALSENGDIWIKYE